VAAPGAETRGAGCRHSYDMSRSSSSLYASFLRHAPVFLIGISVALLGFWVASELDALLYQERQGRRLALLREEENNASSRVAEFAAVSTRAEARTSGLIGRIEIPRLDVSAIIAEGTDDATLRRAVGHVPHTSFPGETGNVGLAAHRDSYFRELRNVSLDDTIHITTPDGVFSYLVDSTLIVPPTEGEVLESTGTAALTLVTCYPFNYVGHAPERFIVRARLFETRPGSGSATHSD
jgi:LPXTG-site transpeptidase (sortase) family protein